MQPYYEDDQVTLHHGDALEVLRALPADSVDAVVCDPPYNLSDSGKRDRDCLRRVLSEVEFPYDDDRDLQGGESGDLPVPPFGRAPLGREGRAVRVDARVGVPEGPVDLQRPTVVKQEVEGGHVAPMLATDGGLPGVDDAEGVEYLSHYVLASADGGDAPFCDGTCGCFAEPSPGVLTVLVALPGSTGGDLPSDLLGGRRRRDSHVWPLNNASSESKCPALVVAGPGAVRRAVLRLDVLRGTGELLTAGSADDGNLPLFCLRPLAVGALTGARGLSPVSKPVRVSVVGDSAQWTFALHIPGHGLNSTGQTGGFMGATWDGWESPAAFQRWCLAWARECLRILKPGGHLLAFGGTRTVHRLASGIEDAGFEIRDGIDWLYGSGFPKSLDVSKAIDKAAGAVREVVGTKLGLPGYSLAPSNEDHRTYGRGLGNTSDPAAECAITAPTTDDARRWEGWGTALKPAREPIVCARKPLSGTVAANVLAYGTGALNIDACRVPATPDLFAKNPHTNSASNGFGQQRSGATYDPTSGRWPTNVVLSHAGNDVDGDLCADGCVPGCPVAELDRQSGVTSSGSRKAGTYGLMGYMGADAAPMPAIAGDSGGASRFFPVFRYEAKAPTSERPKVDGEAHATVKPLALMRWLVQLITPPGGVVLEPFAGSGTTVEACLIENFRCIAVEREAKYLPLIMSRISKPIEPVLFGSLDECEGAP